VSWQWQALVLTGLAVAWLGADVSAQTKPGAEQLPDLEVHYLGLSDRGSVIYQVANRGKGSTGRPFVAEIYINGVQRDSITHSPLPGLSVQTVESNLARLADCKAVTVRLILDAQNSVREVSKANNERSVLLTPRCAQAPR
jgi:hypothetical protein